MHKPNKRSKGLSHWINDFTIGLYFTTASITSFRQSSKEVLSDYKKVINLAILKWLEKQ